MKYTTNYNLKKPLQTEYYNVDDFNDNMDIVDRELADKFSVNGGHITGRIIIGETDKDDSGVIYVKNEDLVIDATGVVETFELHVKLLQLLKNGVLFDVKQLFESSRGTVTVAAYDSLRIYRECADYVSAGENGDWEAINKALSYAKDGMTVELFPGNYNIYGDGILEISSKITVRGSKYGSAVNIRQLKDSFDEPATIFRLLNEVTIENIRFEMCEDSNSPKSAIVIENSDAIVRNCIFHTDGTDGGTQPTAIVVGTRGGSDHVRKGIRIQDNCFDNDISAPCTLDEFGGVDIALRDGNNEIGAVISGNIKVGSGGIKINSDCSKSEIIAYGNGKIIVGAYTEKGQTAFGGKEIYTLNFA